MIIRLFKELGDAENFTYILRFHGIKANLIIKDGMYGFETDEAISPKLLRKLRRMSLRKITEEMIKIRGW